MEMTKEILMKNGYVEIDHPLHKDDKSRRYYQKKIIDDNAKEYYIQALNYLVGTEYEGWEFSSIIYTKEGYAVQVATVQWFPKYCKGNPKTLDDVHKLIDKLYYACLE